MTLDDFPPLTGGGIENDNTYSVFILHQSIISIRLMIQQTESGACVSIFIRGCLVSNREPRMGSFNHSWAAPVLRLPVFHLLSASPLLLSPLLLLLPAFSSPTGGVIKSHITDDGRAALMAPRWIKRGKHSSFDSFRLPRPRCRFHLP